MSIITRFAPSPTGYLHLGGARTALFNWLFAKRYGGQFLLRIEDTDRARSNDIAIQQILSGMQWLGLDWDGDLVFQHSRSERHVEVAKSLLESGRAYKCFSSPEQLKEMRDKAHKLGEAVRYDGTWRDRDPNDGPSGVDPVIRFKALHVGETIIRDGVQGDVKISNEQIDDMVLLRSDGSPTYMLSVVVDDHDMGITNTIRGDDHLTNTARQSQLFDALGWELPKFAHIPLIHGSDGAKLSKRHGAIAVDSYEKMGILPEAMINYLLRLGWSHGDTEIISQSQAKELFSLDGIGKSPSRFNLEKLISLNGHYIRNIPSPHVIDKCSKLLSERWGKQAVEENLESLNYLSPELIKKMNTIVQIADSVEFLFKKRPIEINSHAHKILTKDAQELLGKLEIAFAKTNTWELDHIERIMRDFSFNEGIKFGKIAQPIRAALTGNNISPGIFSIMYILGRSEVFGRISDVVKK
ncbi:MAG: glutamate--tRNA ligase [Gammaproteobacteria bacterium]|nr:glutamate--tRNA ligase [Gammaproteobacteria bacterium]